MMVAGPVGGVLGNRYGRVVPLRLGIVIAGIALALLATMHDERWMLYVWMSCMGVGLAFCFAALGTLVLDYSRPGETGVASGMNKIMRTVGAALGSQIAAAIISSNTLPGTDVPLEAGFTTAFTVSAGVAVLAFLPTLLLRRRPGAD